MRFPRRLLRPIAGALSLTLVTACAPEADVTVEELDTVIARDAIAFDDGILPTEVLDRMGAERVLLLGETHHLREHWALVADLLSELHANGFRQLLIESPHMAGWLFDDYVQGGDLAPDWEPPPFYESRLKAIRNLNEALPADERVHVRTIDANEEWYGGAAGFRDLFGFLVDVLPPTSVDLSLPTGYAAADPADQIDALADVATRLDEHESDLIDAWGPEWYSIASELVEVEKTSIDVRTLRVDDDDEAARTREVLIKELSDRRIAECPCATIINIGAHHAQKAHLMGTDQEWLGDYLAHESTAAGGSIFVVGFSSANTQLEPGAGGTPFDVTTTSPEHELLRRMAESNPGQNVFLPLDDPLFSDRLVAFNSEEVIYATPIRDQFDAVFQYGLAHRMPEA
jgi:hypothetical protein